jgi:hypothetical protein
MAGPFEYFFGRAVFYQSFQVHEKQINCKAPRLPENIRDYVNGVPVFVFFEFSFNFLA